MNAAVIGGAGLFGSAVIAELVARGLFREITLIDAQEELANAEIEDLRAAHLEEAPQLNHTSNLSAASQSDVIIICRGFAAQSSETRLDLARRNLTHFCWLLSELQRVGLKRESIVIIASEPTELMTALAASYLDLPDKQVLGMGTVVDARRLRAGLASKLKLPVSEIQVNTVGIRGKYLVPLWSGASIAGEPISKLKPWEGTWQHEVEQMTRNADHTQLRGKGGAWRAPAAAVADVARAVVRDEQAILPVCVNRHFRTPKYELRRTSIALPTVVGRSGASDTLELKLWPKEQAALKQGARQTQRALNILANQR